MSVATQPDTVKVTPVPTIITATNPATGEKVGQVRISTFDEVKAVMARSRAAQPAWSALGVKARLAMLHHLPAVMMRQLDLAVDTLIEEAGKPHFEALSEVWVSVEQANYYLHNARR